ncbi:MAG: hypothetical protein KAR19_01035 [Bacteroidales bacterium]|nr:hypothetical protein [Bacteroidales bacterium]
MEIKHTIEILTKDIQDIEKLIGNLNNSQEGSAIELDLALSKLRNVYEILTMIKADMLYARTQPVHQTGQTVPAASVVPPPAPEPIPVPEPTPEPEPVAMPQSVAEDTTTTAEPEATANQQAEILAEKFSTESSINENMAGQRKTDMDSKLMGQPIDNISRNIGINDRFLIIRELFGGDADKFKKLIDNLDGAGNFQDAIILIEDSFSDNMEHEGRGILVGLAKRRFIRD